MPHFNESFSARRWLRFVVDHPVGIILLALIITSAFAWQLPNLRFQNSIYDLAIEDLDEAVLYETFKKDFGSEEIILVVVKAANILDESAFQRVQTLSQNLSEIKGVRRVISLPGIKKAMDVTGKWNLSDFEKVIVPVDLFQRNLISSDRKTTVISLILEDIRRKDQIVQSIDKLIKKEPPGLDLYQIGMPLVSKALAEYTKKDFLRLPPVTFLTIGLVLIILFRNFRGMLIPAGSVLMALIWTFGLMALTDTPLSMLTMIVPIFVIAVGTAYCMYIFPEYGEALDEARSPKEAAYGCFSRIGFPTILAVITTTIGLGSLLVNKISGIRDFALFSCFGIWSMLVIILFLLPAVFSLLPLPKDQEGQRFIKVRFLDPLLDKIIDLNLHHQKKTLPIVAFIALLGLAGIYRISIETNPVGYFKENTTIRRHFQDIYQDMAGSFPVNVVLDSKEEDYFEDPKHLGAIPKLQRFLDSLEGVDKTISFADYFKLVNYAGNNYDDTYYAMPEEGFEVRTLMNSFKTMLGQDVFDSFMKPDLSKTNILLRTHISSSRDFLKTKEEILTYLQENLPENFEYQVTGFGIVISQSSDLLSKGQARSLSITFVLIFIIMFVLFMSGKVGFIAMLPNCFPIIVNFGLMGWIGVELSVATSLVASIAIGLAVDDTIHYMVRYNREFKKDLDKTRALRDTIRRIGRPIIFTTVTISLGFSVLMFSHFGPTAVFGLMMVITMFSALVGDLIILPSLMTHVEFVTLWDLLRLKLGKDPEKGIPLFKGLSRSQVHYILMAGALKTFDRGEFLFRKGETSDSMYAVISGELEVVDIVDDSDEDSIQGNKVLINRIGTGDVVGEMGMVRSCRRSATVITSEATELLEINDKMIRRLQWLYPPTAQKFFFNLMSTICDRLEYTTECLADATIIDALTGLHTRDHFMNSLAKEIDRANRYGTDCAVCIMDLDNFKAINHVHGHETGDRIIGEIGSFIQKHLRRSDHACRYRGQQFALVLVNSPIDKARSACERLRQLLSEQALEGHSSPIYVTASMGFVALEAGIYQSGADLIEMATRALRDAKAMGRNRVHAYGS